jgi:two-component system, cell cycle sensor histidine kinase and response regulator CckA
MRLPNKAHQGPPEVLRVHRLVVFTALAAIAFGVVVIESYVFDVGPLIPLTPFLPPTPPLVALMFMLAGVSLLSLGVGLAGFQRLPALLTTLLAATFLSEYLFQVDVGIDRLLFPQAVDELSRIFPGRPAPISAAAFLFVGVALLIGGYRSDGKPRRWYTAIILGAIILPVIPIVGLLLNVPELYSLTPTIGTALHTALALLLLAIGVAAATHESALLRLLRDRDTGTILLRRLLPLAILLPLLFAAGSLVALHYGLYAAHVGLVLYVSWCIGMFLGVAFWMAKVVHRADAERRAADEAQAQLAVRDALLEAEIASAGVAQDSERRTRELLDILSHAPVFARGFDGRIRFWSAGAERLYGWSSEEATGALSRDLLPTDFPILEREAEADLLDAGEWHGEIVRRSRDGARVQVASHWILHRDHVGSPHTVIEIDNDVTHQKRAEEALREGEARYRALVAATTQVIWTASPGGKRPLDLTQWEAFTGQSALEADWDGWIQAIHPDDQAEAIRLWNDAVCNRKALLTEHRLRRHDGEYRHMEARAVPVFDEQGAVREWIWAHADITDRVLAQERLGQAQKLQAVGTLAGGVAHEVNNQLMAVLGFGDFVLKALGPGHSQASDVEEMIRGATRAAKVAQQLLTFSRRQVNQSGLLDIHSAVEALRPVLKQLLGADKTLEILPSRTRRKVLADPTQIDQVLINLAANARDAMGTGGRLSIVTDEVVLDESYARSHTVGRLIPGPYVRLIVSDTGSGMDRDTLTKIFEPFFTTKPVGAGTGLGLSTVYGIVKQHDGFIWAYSELGLGTTMKIYIPAALGDHIRVAEKKDEPRVEPSVHLEPALILVVEDEPAVRNLVRRSLEGAGLTVIEAENGRHALEMVATLKEPPDLVLTDVIMAGLNGRELSEALAMIQPGLPVLFMSGYTGDEVLARSLLPAKAPFIQKPFVPEELVARVRLLLATSPATSPTSAPRSVPTSAPGPLVIAPQGRGPSSSTTH